MKIVIPLCIFHDILGSQITGTTEMPIITANPGFSVVQNSDNCILSVYSNAAVCQFYPQIMQTTYQCFSFLLQEFLGPANVFFLFGAISLLALVFVILNVPETKGLSLEEIESKLLK
jgi:hypothetical protein